MLEGSKKVIQEGKNFELATQEIANDMNEMAAGADRINIAVNRVNMTSGENGENNNILARRGGFSAKRTSASCKTREKK
jgi:methyl-accepting chemotaxis protein